ncbi:MAG: hypothetical protein ABSF44_15875 [Candidatus Bathyarchaeia archaeon]
MKPQTYPKTCLKNTFVLGTKIGKCPLCKETRTLFLLRYGVSLCEECLTVCKGIVEQLELEEVESKT